MSEGTPKTMFQALLNAGLDEVQAAEAYMHVRDFTAQHSFNRDQTISDHLYDNFKKLFHDSKSVDSFLDQLKTKVIEEPRPFGHSIPSNTGR